ncbi:hypothetical protein Mapa_011626 [Marchantia paleacea]|nr:hypothetical protein Mapa_011626 [Marchantia paleacea]
MKLAHRRHYPTLQAPREYFSSTSASRASTSYLIGEGLSSCLDENFDRQTLTLIRMYQKNLLMTAAFAGFGLFRVDAEH